MCPCSNVIFVFTGNSSKRKSFPPAKYSIYWDSNIPMEYYEQDFLEFEEYALATGKTIRSSNDNPHANGNFMLANFAKYEKFWKRESRKEWLKYVKQYSQKRARQQEVGEKKSKGQGLKKVGKVNFTIIKLFKNCFETSHSVFEFFITYTEM